MATKDAEATSKANEVDDARAVNVLAAFTIAAHDRFLAELAGMPAMTPSRAGALATLKGYPGERIDELATVLNLTSSGATRLITAMVADGLVDKRSGSDARTTTVYLTAAGTRAANRVLRARQQCFGELLTELSQRQKHTLIALVERMLSGLGSDARQEWADQTCRFCDYKSCPQPSCPVAASGGDA